MEFAAYELLEIAAREAGDEETAAAWAWGTSGRRPYVGSVKP